MGFENSVILRETGGSRMTANAWRRKIKTGGCVRCMLQVVWYHRRVKRYISGNPTNEYDPGPPEYDVKA
jgi:hypothetical protein